MRSKWSVVCFEDVCKEIVDCEHFTPHYADKGMPILRALNITPDRLDLTNLRYISEDDFRLMTRRVRPIRDDIIISKHPPVGESAMVDFDLDISMGQNMALLRPNQKKIIPRYLLYFLLSKTGRDQISSYACGGSVLNHIRIAYLKKLEIPLPPLPDQVKISNILGSIDKKIDSLNRINKVLEQIASSLFKSWFIDFEFPNEQGKPHKSSGGEMVDSELGKIPKRWKAGNLSEICDFVMGQSPPGSSYNETGEGVVFYQGVRDFGEFFPSPRVYCTIPKKFASAKDVLFSVRAPIGSINVANQKCCIGRGLAALHLKKNHGPFLYYLLKSNYDQWQSYEANGTVFGAVTKNDINDFKIIAPSLDVIHSFNLLTNPLYDKIWNDNLLIQILTEIGDSLLPKLMSGEIRA